MFLSQSQSVVRSKAQKLRTKLAQILQTDESKVDIFSVMVKQRRPPITDVRFSAHGSPYYKPVKLNGLVLLNREEVRVASIKSFFFLRLSTMRLRAWRMFKVSLNFKQTFVNFFE